MFFLRLAVAPVLATALFLVSSPASAQSALLTDPSDFTGSETLIDFNGLANGTAISSQYLFPAAPAVGAHFALSGGGSPWSLGETLTNRPPGWAPGDPALENVNVTFLTKMNRVGFRISNNNDDDLVLSIKCRHQGVLLGAMLFETSASFTFVGVESVDEFDQVSIEVTGSSFGAFFVDDLRFENDPGAVIVDTTAPQVTISYPPDGTIFGTNDALITADVTDASPTTLTSTPAGLSAAFIGGGGSVSDWVPLPSDGEFVISVNATDVSGNVGGASVTVIRDTTAPVVTVLSPANGSVVGTSPVTATLLVDDLTSTTVFFAGQTYFLPPGRHLVVGTLNLVEGTNFKNWEAIDQANNSTGVGTLELTLDLTAPVVSVDAPADGEFFGPSDFSGPAIVPVTATVNDLTATTVTSDPAGVSASLGAGGGVATGSVALVEGPNTIEVSATDEASLTSSNSVLVILDTTPPVVVVDSPADLSSASGVIEFAGRAADVGGAYGSGVAQVDLRVDGNLVTSLVDPPFTFIELYDTLSLTEGLHAFSIDAVDNEGNSTTSLSSNVTIDNSPPTISITNPSVGGFVSGTFDFTATVADSGSGVDEIVVMIAGEMPNVGDGSGSYGGVPSVDVLSRYDSTVEPDGPIALSIEVMDVAGTTSSVIVYVEVDNTAPTKALVAPLDGDVVSGVIDLVAAAADPNLAELVLLVDGNEVGSTATGALTVPYDTTAGLDGVVHVEALAVDLAGNSSSCIAFVTVDNLSVRLSPKTLSLSSRGMNTSVTATVTGVNADLLLPTEAHAIELRIPGGAAIPCTMDVTADDAVVDGELTIKFDRQAVIASVRAAITAGMAESGQKVEVSLFAEGREIGSAKVKIVGN